MRKKTLIATIVIFVVAILCISSVIVSHLPKYDKEEIDIFQSHKADFEKVNSYILKTYGDDSTSNIIHLEKQIYQIVGLSNDRKIDVNKEIIASLNCIVPAFDGYDFSFINVLPERVSYCGEGYRMYVYSTNGKAPSYYYYEGDGMSPEIYTLGDNWYLLKVYFI